jgi:hypothetical protein
MTQYKVGPREPGRALRYLSAGMWIILKINLSRRSDRPDVPSQPSGPGGPCVGSYVVHFFYGYRTPDRDRAEGFASVSVCYIRAGRLTFCVVFEFVFTAA